MESTRGYLDMELLRFSTAGSVDDGKSTLIGRLLYDSKSIFEDQLVCSNTPWRASMRLLYDSKSIFEDQLEAVEAASKSRGNEEVNLALLTDGLRAEREQGITIDVAYRYFATPKRKFIIADTPGHIQYTRNMVTGASTADLSIILIDARHGVLEQTVRHSYISSLLGIPHILVAINKMDLVDSANQTLGLEGFFRFPVQYVIRPISSQFPDYRGYAGRVSGGIIRPGDKIRVLPSGTESTVKSIDFVEEHLEEAYAPMSVTLTLNDDIDISRGDTLVKADEKQPSIEQDITLDVCWFNERPGLMTHRNGLQIAQQGRSLIPRSLITLVHHVVAILGADRDKYLDVCWLNERPAAVRNKYVIRQATFETQGLIRSINYRRNINTLEKEEGVSELKMNDIAEITIHTANPLVFDKYTENKVTGSLIFIDPDTNETVGAGLIK